MDGRTLNAEVFKNWRQFRVARQNDADESVEGSIIAASKLLALDFCKCAKTQRDGIITMDKGEIILLCVSWYLLYALWLSFAVLKALPNDQAANRLERAKLSW